MGVAHDHRQFSPTAEIPFGKKITEILQKFANDNELAFHPYYHDLPVWIVHEVPGPGERKERVRRLQVCAYLVSRDPYLSFVPSIHILVGGKVMVPKRTPTTRFELKEVFAGGRLNRGKFLRRLETAWQMTTTLKYTPRDLLEVRLTPKAVLENATPPLRPS